MPLLLVVIILIGLSGGMNSPQSSRAPVSDSDVIVSTQFGGLTRNATQQAVQTTPTPVPTPTVAIPSALTVEEKIEPVILVPPILDTFSAQDITTNSVRLRGEIEYVGSPYKGRLFFIYSENASDVSAIADSLSEMTVSTALGSGGIYSKIIYRLEDDTTYYYRLCFDAEVKTCADVVSFTTVEDTSRSTTYTLPLVTTRRAETIQAEKATLNGYYRLYDAENTIAFFVYGQNRTLINDVPSDYDEYREVRESGDDLQRVRAGVNVPPSGEPSREIDDLEKDTTYYHRLCIAYDDDEAMGIKCGSVLSFETKSRQRDIPEISSTQAIVSGSSAELSTRASMEDYTNGHLFVVYGTSESRINDVAKKDEFRQVYQSGDQLQRVSIDTDFDRTETVLFTASDLIESAYYYRFCVEYEAENDYGNDDLFLSCGEVKAFEIL